MKYHTSTKKTNTYWQISFIIILYACCIFQIWNLKHDGQGLWINTLLPTLNITHFGFKLITAILLLINALSVTLFLRRFSLIEIRNHYPTILYLLFSFIFTNTLTLWGMIAGMFFLWGILPVLFGMNEGNIHPRVFMYGLYCGILSLTYTPFLLLLTFIYIVLFKERYYSIRAFILPIIGACLAYQYVFAIFYLLDQMDKIPEFLTLMKMQANSIPFFTPVKWEPMFVFFLLISVLLSGISFFQIWRKLRSMVVNKRKKHIILLIITFLQTVFLFSFHTPYDSLLSQIGVILLAVLLSASMLYMKKAILYKIIFFILFAIAWANILLVLS